MAQPGAGSAVTAGAVLQLVRQKDELEARIRACYELLRDVSTAGGDRGYRGRFGGDLGLAATAPCPPPERPLSPRRAAWDPTSRWWTPRASPGLISTCTGCGRPGTTSPVSGVSPPGPL